MVYVGQSSHCNLLFKPDEQAGGNKMKNTKNTNWTEDAVALKYPIVEEEEVVVNYIYITDIIHLAALALFFLGSI